MFLPAANLGFARWSQANGVADPFNVQLRPHTAGSELLELRVVKPAGEKAAREIFATIRDRRSRTILFIRDQETIDPALRNKRMMTLLHLFLVHRYKAETIHYVTPTDENVGQAHGMTRLGFFDQISTEIGDIIVAGIAGDWIAELLKPDHTELMRLINKG